MLSGVVPPPDAVFVDAFYAQAVAARLGLPDLIDLERARTHWKHHRRVPAPTDDDGNLTGPPTMLDENRNHYHVFHFTERGRPPRERMSRVRWNFGGGPLRVRAALTC